jgi:ribokinase
MVGSVGDDVFGQSLLDNLTAAGVEASAVTRVAGPSGVAVILLAANGENSIVVVPGANGFVTPAVIRHHADLILSAGMVLTQLELPSETTAHLLALCAGAGVPVVLDPAPAAPLPDSTWRQVAWFTPNETEAAFYTRPQLTPKDAAAELEKRGLKGIVLKRGIEGAYIAAGDRADLVKSFHVEAIDTVGAGDCFNGAFAVALLEGRDPIAAARFASAAAAISVTRHGAQASMPSRAEVESFLAVQT